MRNTTLIRIDKMDKKKIEDIKIRLQRVKPDITNGQIVKLMSIDVDLDKITKKLLERRNNSKWR